MNTRECAEELYNLIVIKGRWKNKPPSQLVWDEPGFDGLPEFVQEMWLAKAVGFAEQNNFKLED